MRVEIDEDDLSLIVPWLGGAPDCERYPRAEVIESNAAVAVVPLARTSAARDTAQLSATYIACLLSYASRSALECSSTSTGTRNKHSGKSILRRASRSRDRYAPDRANNLPCHQRIAGGHRLGRVMGALPKKLVSR